MPLPIVVSIMASLPTIHRNASLFFWPIVSFQEIGIGHGLKIRLVFDVGAQSIICFIESQDYFLKDKDIINVGATKTLNIIGYLDSS